MGDPTLLPDLMEWPVDLGRRQRLKRLLALQQRFIRHLGGPPKLHAPLKIPNRPGLEQGRLALRGRTTLRGR